MNPYIHILTTAILHNSASRRKDAGRISRSGGRRLYVAMGADPGVVRAALGDTKVMRPCDCQLGYKPLFMKILLRTGAAVPPGETLPITYHLVPDIA
jgi:hypothetical protein